jgi:hypothetical protein
METWTAAEQSLIAIIMATETMHDPDCRGCRSCDDSNRESCHRLCTRSEAIRRMRRRTQNGAYVARNEDKRIYTRELKRWCQATLNARRADLGLPPVSRNIALNTQTMQETL